MSDILLATDSDQLADEVEAALGGRHLLHRVRRGADVLAAIDEVDPALVVLDLQIGNMGGMATCLAIRQEEGMGRIEPRPVVMLLDRDADEYLANVSDADAIMMKPLDAFAFGRLVDAHVAESEEPTRPRRKTMPAAR